MKEPYVIMELTFEHAFIETMALEIKILRTLEFDLVKNNCLFKDAHFFFLGLNSKLCLMRLRHQNGQPNQPWSHSFLIH